MTETREQAQMRQHWSEMRQAASGLGKDFSIELRHLERNIEKLGTVTGKEGKYLLYDIQDEAARLRRSIETEARAFPGRVANAVSDVGERIQDGASRVGGATRDVLESAGKKAKDGTRNAFATAAGVKRTPMREWKPDP
ncbi:MAG: hypothetical protein L3K19_00055 [Thermoplasmata archaeon]|nr:hypothetical protein [Thermoplasmata archaeon]